MASTLVSLTRRAGLPRQFPTCSRISSLRQSISSPTRRSFSSYLVTPKELADALAKNPPSRVAPDPRTVAVCASWFMPKADKTGMEVYREKRIPKARFFDLDKVVDRRSPYPHMLPGAKEFASAMSEIGVRREDTVVVYDSKELGIFSAPRVAWTMRLFGHPNVHILNNFRLWVEEGFPTESGELYSVECCTYPINQADEKRVASFEDVREVAVDYNKEGAEGVQVLDARGKGRFDGTEPEVREGMRSGHMPGAINIPFGELLDPETKTFLEREKLREVFEKKGVNPTKPIISTCGSGVTACIIDTALEVAGYGSPEARRVYDGSWT